MGGPVPSGHVLLLSRRAWGDERREGEESPALPEAPWAPGLERAVREQHGTIAACSWIRWRSYGAPQKAGQRRAMCGEYCAAHTVTIRT